MDSYSTRPINCSIPSGDFVILALDTAGPYPVVAAVSAEEDILFAGSGERTRAHAEDLAPLLREALSCGEPSAVAVGRGPGAFTGLRVGLVAAQTLGWAINIAVAGVCSLDVVAVQFGLSDGWAVLDARRDEVYLAQYQRGIRLDGPMVLSKSGAQERIDDQPAVGDTELLRQPDRRARGGTSIDPNALAAVALVACQSRSPEPPEPDYLRSPDVTWSAANSGRSI